MKDLSPHSGNERTQFSRTVSLDRMPPLPLQARPRLTEGQLIIQPRASTICRTIVFRSHGLSQKHEHLLARGSGPISRGSRLPNRCQILRCQMAPCSRNCEIFTRTYRLWYALPCRLGTLIGRVHRVKSMLQLSSISQTAGGGFQYPPRVNDTAQHTRRMTHRGVRSCST